MLQSPKRTLAPCFHFLPLRLQEPWKLTRNQELNIMHVDNASRFLSSVDHFVVRGDTLVFDFVFFMHPVRKWPCMACVAGYDSGCMRKLVCTRIAVTL